MIARLALVLGRLLLGIGLATATAQQVAPPVLPEPPQPARDILGPLSFEEIRSDLIARGKIDPASRPEIDLEDLRARLDSRRMGRPPEAWERPARPDQSPPPPQSRPLSRP